MNWVLSAIVAIFVGGTTAAAWSQEQPVTLRVTSMAPAGSAASTIWFNPWANRINASANGAVKVEVVDGYALANVTNAYDRTINDVIQIGWVFHPAVRGKFPLSEVAALPYLGTRAEPMSVALWRLYKTGMLDEEYDEVIPLALAVFGQVSLHFGKPPATLDDLNGLKIIASGQITSRVLQVLGAAPVTGGVSDMYTMLQRGVADATLTGWASFAPFKLAEVTTFHVEQPLGTVSNMFAMSRKKYESLPEAGRKALDANSGEATVRAFGEYLDREEDLAVAKHTVTRLTAAQEQSWKKKIEVVVDEWTKAHPKRDAVLATYRQLLSAATAKQ